MSSTIRLLGMDFLDAGPSAAAALIAARSPDAPFAYVVTPNADHFMRLERDPGLRSVYEGAWLRLMDSRVVARAARVLGLAAPKVATGSDVTAELLMRHVLPAERVTIVGLSSARVPALIWRCGIAPPFHHDPPIGFDRDPAAFEDAVRFVRAHPARLTFLAVGSPRQELLAAAIAAGGSARGVGLCVGASLDFLTGRQRRAPGWVQTAGLEWLHRMCGDPARLARRYLVDDPAVFGLILRARLRRRSARTDE